jgi:hypothetical protein
MLEEGGRKVVSPLIEYFSEHITVKVVSGSAKSGMQKDFFRYSEASREELGDEIFHKKG